MHAYRLMIRDVMVYAVSNGKTRFLSLFPSLQSWGHGYSDTMTPWTMSAYAYV